MSDALRKPGHVCTIVNGVEAAIEELKGGVFDVVVTDLRMPTSAGAEFEGEKVHVLRVTYDPEVGTDVWDFFFDPETSAVVGCRFYHDEAANDGEYIVFTGEVHDEASGLRMPGGQGWYYNDGRGHLATDTVTKFEVTR